MNKKSLLSLYLFAASTVLSFVTIHIMSLFDISKWVGVSVALSLFVVMAILLLVATKKKKVKKHIKAVRYATLAVNAIADGLAISSLFTYLGRFPQVWQSAAAAAVLIAVFALYLLLTYIPFTRQHYIISMVLYVLVVVGGGIAFCATASQSVKAVSVLTLLYMIIFIAFFIPLADNTYNAEEHIEKITYFSFAGIIVAIIVLAIISESDADFLSGLDGGIGSAGTAKKRNPYDYMAYNYAAFSAAANANIINARYGDPPGQNTNNTVDKE